MLDDHTSNMCLESWGRIRYARALIEVLSECALVESLIVAISLLNGSSHAIKTIDVEFEWSPPQCATCKKFGLNNE